MFPTQVHAGLSTELTPMALSIKSGSIKPLDAFWTSTWDDDNGTSAWVEWCRAEEFGDIESQNLFVLEVSPDAKVYTVDSLEDLVYLLDTCGAVGTHYMPYVNWEKVAQDYDGVQVTDRGQWATRLTTPGLYTWDCESTAWFHWVFTKVTRIK